MPVANHLKNWPRAKLPGRLTYLADQEPAIGASAGARALVIHFQARPPSTDWKFEGKHALILCLLPKRSWAQRIELGKIGWEQKKLRMNSPQAGKSRTFIASIAFAAVSHVLAWAAFLWMVYWPDFYQGVSASPVESGGNFATDSVTVRHSASFVEVNGYGPLIPLFVPVLVTGLALAFLLTRTEWRKANAPVLWLHLAVLLLHGGLGYLSFGILYAPSVIALAAAVAVFGLGRGLPRLNGK